MCVIRGEFGPEWRDGDSIIHVLYSGIVIFGGESEKATRAGGYGDDEERRRKRAGIPFPNESHGLVVVESIQVPFLCLLVGDKALIKFNS